MIDIRTGLIYETRLLTTYINTLDQALNDYLASNNNLKERTSKDYNDVIKRYAADWLNPSLFEITPTMIEKKHQQIAKRSPAQANLLMRYIRAI